MREFFLTILFGLGVSVVGAYLFDEPLDTSKMITLMLVYSIYLRV